MMACRASSLTNLLCVTCEFVSVQSCSRPSSEPDQLVAVRLRLRVLFAIQLSLLNFQKFVFFVLCRITPTAQW